ncbi:hypothetical protein [Methyloprofundus sp.]
MNALLYSNTVPTKTTADCRADFSPLLLARFSSILRAVTDADF